VRGGREWTKETQRNREGFCVVCGREREREKERERERERERKKEREMKIFWIMYIKNPSVKSIQYR
jgi:hypothetical protein